MADVDWVIVCTATHPSLTLKKIVALALEGGEQRVSCMSSRISSCSGPARTCSSRPALPELRIASSVLRKASSASAALATASSMAIAFAAACSRNRGLACRILLAYGRMGQPVRGQMSSRRPSGPGRMEPQAPLELELVATMDSYAMAAECSGNSVKMSATSLN